MSNPYSMARHMLIASTAALLIACGSTPTPYQEATSGGGFSSQMIENDRARVTFSGNSVTKRETVENYLLYRAAELTIEKGYDSFTLQARNVDKDTNSRITQRGFISDPYFGYSFYRPSYGWSYPYAYSRFDGFYGARGFGRSRFYGSGRDPFFTNYDVHTITKYQATAEVKFSHGTQVGNEQSYNARQVLDNLASEIQYPEADAEHLETN